MARRVMAVVGGLVLAGSLAACGGTGTDAAQPSRTVPPGSVPGVTTTLAPVCTPADAPMTIEAGKPTVEVPTGEAPTELVSTDITVGDGPVAAVGDTVSMQYVGVLYSDGTEFDSSWSRDAEPFEFTLGPGAQVIEGWNQGIAGMAVGGRRQLVIPPDLAYADQDKGTIPPNSTLVFVVDLVQVCTPAGAAAETPVPSSTPASDLPAESSTTSVVPSSSTTIGTESSTTTAG